LRYCDPSEYAVVLNCPVFLHIEFESLEAKFGLTVRTQLMNKLKQILAGNPDQQFILTHVAELDPAECRGLINEFSNIHFTINFRDLTRLMTGEPVVDYSEEDWNALFEEHPDRFVFAFDRVFPFQWDAYSRDMEYTQDKLANLSQATARAIASENASCFWAF